MTIVASVLAINVNSQEHLKFKNIPIDGTVNSFAQKLEKIGFEIVLSKANQTALKGSFMSEECLIMVTGTRKTNIVWKVTVYLPKEASWNTIKNDYFDVKKIFQQKYGEGLSRESFFAPHKDGDGNELELISSGEGMYTTYFTKKLGVIAVRISKASRIAILYEDKINLELRKREIARMIKDDI